MKNNIIKISERKEIKERVARWFSDKWGIEYSAYLDSINESFVGNKSVPQWYVCLEDERIIGGIGVIENDFHERNDLTPNLCALFVEPDVRGHGIAGELLRKAEHDLYQRGIDTIYLLTDHTSFYERYGWEFFCLVKGDDGTMSRMYKKQNINE